MTMKQNYLVLPFFDDIKKTSLFARQGYNSSLKSRFKVYSKFDCLLPFVCEVGNDCNFQIIIRDFNGEICGNIFQSQIKHKIYSKGLKKYLVYNGDRIGCLELGECRLPYSMQIGNFYSEWFWVADDTDNLLKVEIGNSIDFNQIPYSIGFKQWFYLESTIGTPEVDSFSVTNRDTRGRTQTTYQRLVETYNFYLLGVPSHVKNVVTSMEVLDNVTFKRAGQILVAEEKQAKVKSKRNELGFEFYDVELSVVNKEFEEVGVCGTSLFVVTPCFVDAGNELECFPMTAIKSVGIDCSTESIIEQIIIDCNNTECTKEDIIFYATVTY